MSTIEFNPLNAALTTLEGLVLRHTFVVMFLFPNTSDIALRVAPAYIPVPSGAGFNNTTLPQNLDFISYGRVPFITGINIIFFLA